MSDLPSGTVTFLFTDIDGSTALWEQDRKAIAIRSGQHFESNDRPPVTTTVVERYGHRVELNTLEAALLTRVDGKRPIREIVNDDARNESDAPQRVQRRRRRRRLAREFFARMVDWDHLQYEIP